MSAGGTFEICGGVCSSVAIGCGWPVCRRVRFSAPAKVTTIDLSATARWLHYSIVMHTNGAFVLRSGMRAL
jgi:hypothetical protein